MTPTPNPQPSGGPSAPAPTPTVPDVPAPSDSAPTAAASAVDPEIARVFKETIEQNQGFGGGADLPGWAERPASRPEQAGWSRERIILLQRQMRRAGLLVPPYREGVWDAQTSTAFSGAIAEANTMGTTVDDALRRLQSAALAMPVADAGAAPFTPRSPEQLAQDMKALWQQYLGRPPDDAEIARFSAQFSGMESAAHQQNVAYQQAASQAAMSAELTGTPTWANMPAGAPTGPVSDDDLASQFRERFEAAYKPEIERRVRVEEAAEQRGTLVQSLAGMDAAIARG